jgi:pheromone shutdown protein TraB
MKNLIAIFELLRLSLKMLELRSLEFIENQKIKLHLLIEKSAILIFLIILSAIFVGFGVLGIVFGIYLFLTTYLSKITAVFILSIFLIFIAIMFFVVFKKKAKEIKEIL